MPNLTQHFHGLGERRASEKVAGITGQRVVTQTRELTYRFHNHYHPFTQELDHRLIHGSIPGLQAEDTEYATRAILQAAVTASFQKSPQAAVVSRSLKAKEDVRLPDGTTLTLATGQMATFRGHAVVLNEAGTRVRLLPNALVTLPPLTLVENAAGERLRLDAAVAAVIPSGDPRPRLFEEFFAK